MCQSSKIIELHADRFDLWIIFAAEVIGFHHLYVMVKHVLIKSSNTAQIQISFQIHPHHPKPLKAIKIYKNVVKRW
jgi:hypothetical protein